MNTNISLRQFVKDGLVGAAVVLIIFLININPFFGPFAGLPKDMVKLMFFLDFSGKYFGYFSLVPFPAPMPFVFMMAFIGVGLGGQYLETTMTSRKEWAAAIRKILGISWLAGIGYCVIYWVYFMIPTIYFISITRLVDVTAVLRSFVSIAVFFIVGGGFGAVFGYIIGSVMGIIFKPQKRLNRIVIGAFSSALVGCGVFLLKMSWAGFASG